MSYTSQLQKKFFLLPKSLQDAVRSEENNTFLLNLAKKYMFNEDQQAALVHTSAYVLLGEVSRTDFGRHIARIDGVGEAAARAISKLVDEKLFMPLVQDIDEALQKRIPRDSIEPQDTERELTTEPQESFAEPSQEFIPPETSTPQKWRMPREATATPVAPAPVAEKEQPEEVIIAQTPPPPPEPKAPTEPVQTPKVEVVPTPQVFENPEIIEPIESKTVAPDEPATPDVITIPTITITKPPRFIPLKDLKQGSIKARPAPQGVPSRDTMPSFQKTPPPSSQTNPSTTLKASNAMHTLKNDASPTPVPTPTSTSSVLPRIEPTPEKLASTVITPQPQAATPANPVTTSSSAQGKLPSNDPYHEPIDTP